jgi:hypothetical protein
MKQNNEQVTLSTHKDYAGIVMGYGLDGRASIPGRDKRFLYSVQASSGSDHVSMAWCLIH